MARAVAADALDRLCATRLDAAFETVGRDVFTDPWEARNAYIGPILDRSDESVDAFLLEWTGHDPDHEDAVKALRPDWNSNATRC
ncbi:MAG: DUF3536 domain-containing protein [Trueperaceae bacterium]|nr:DUF3536 domain-containing protein [Trueperaceae bacterium]